MSVNELLKFFGDAENTADYQFESAVVDLTEEICDIMEAKGISRSDLARQLGKSRSWVTKVLRGDRNLTLKTVVDILWELGYKASVHIEPVFNDLRSAASSVAGDPGTSVAPEILS